MRCGEEDGPNQSMKPTAPFEITSVTLPRHPSVAHLFLVRPNIMKYQIFFIAVAWLLTSVFGAGAAESAPSSADQLQVTEAVRSFFAAAAADDLTRLRTVSAPDFYAFDAGGRFSGDAL